MHHDRTSTTRRTLLATVGSGIAAGVIGSSATADSSQPATYALVQGDDCAPIQPVEGDEPVRSRYEYRLPERYVSEENGAAPGETGLYASEGTTDLQRAQTSIAFLYRGPEGLSLVVVHGSATERDGGAVTFQFAGLPEDGRWIVKDDLYRDPETGEIAPNNHDVWDLGGTDHRIDWTWGSSGTDGGAFGDLGDEFDVTIAPAFNEAAALYDQYYEGTITDWEFCSGSDGAERIALDMTEPIRIVTDPCQSDGDSDRDDEPDGRNEGRGPGDRDEGQGPGDRDGGRGPGNRGKGRGPGDRGEGRGPGDRGEGRGPPDSAGRRGPPNEKEGRGPGDRGKGRGPGDRGKGRGP